MGKKKELGKGIRALLSNIEEGEEGKKNVVKKLSRHIEEIDLEDIIVNPYQPRTSFDISQLRELSNSIKTYGIIQPITVRDLKDGTFQLITGERRLRASKMAGLKSIPAFIRLADDNLMLEMALVENIQRENLNPLEVSLSYQRLISEFDFTHENLAERVGKKRATVSNYIRLLKLPPEIQSALKNEEISMGHARTLLGVRDLADQLYFFKETIRKKLSVRALEDTVKNYNAPKPIRVEKEKKVDPELQSMEKKIAEKLGSKTVISRNQKGKGEIKIAFRSDEELNLILQSLLE